MRFGVYWATARLRCVREALADDNEMRKGNWLWTTLIDKNNIFRNVVDQKGDIQGLGWEYVSFITFVVAVHTSGQKNRYELMTMPRHSTAVFALKQGQNAVHLPPLSLASTAVLYKLYVTMNPEKRFYSSSSSASAMLVSAAAGVPSSSSAEAALAGAASSSASSSSSLSTTRALRVLFCCV